MKRTLLIVLSLIISAALVTTVFAQEKKAEPAKPAATALKAAAKSKALYYAGTVASMDSAAKLVVVKGKKGEMTFDVADAKWKGYKAMDEAKAGDKVAVKYVEKDGKMVAALVTKAAEKKQSKPVSKPSEGAKPAAAPTQTPAKQ